jgi:hypothetical protein
MAGRNTTVIAVVSYFYLDESLGLLFKNLNIVQSPTTPLNYDR